MLVLAGFSSAEPWLPIPEEHRIRAVDVQEASPDSVLNTCRRFVAWRRQHPALRAGSIRLIETPGDTLAFLRELGTESILAAFNLTADLAWIEPPSDPTVTPLEGHGFTKTISEGRIQLPPYGAFYGASRKTGD